MKHFGWISFCLFIALVGCGKKETDAERIGRQQGLTPEQYSQTPEGKNAIESGDGTRVKVISNPNLEDYGVAQYPGSKLEDGGAAYERITGELDQITYTLSSSDDFQSIVDFYAKELEDEDPNITSTDAFVSGKIDENGSILVTITKEKSGVNLIRVDSTSVVESD